MEQYIPKSTVVEEIERRKEKCDIFYNIAFSNNSEFAKIAIEEQKRQHDSFLSFINTLEVKEVDSMIHTIIAECCDWLAVYTDLSHNEIEGCRNLMLTVKDEQLKAQKGE